jgi:hypothetical protein
MISNTGWLIILAICWFANAIVLWIQGGNIINIVSGALAAGAFMLRWDMRRVLK